MAVLHALAAGLLILLTAGLVLALQFVGQWLVSRREARGRPTPAWIKRALGVDDLGTQMMAGFLLWVVLLGGAYVIDKRYGYLLQDDYARCVFRDAASVETDAHASALMGACRAKHGRMTDDDLIQWPAFPTAHACMATLVGSPRSERMARQVLSICRHIAAAHRPPPQMARPALAPRATPAASPPPKPAPLVIPTPAPAPAPAKPACRIKPVMTDADYRACGREPPGGG